MKTHYRVLSFCTDKYARLSVSDIEFDSVSGRALRAMHKGMNYPVKDQWLDEKGNTVIEIPVIGNAQCFVVERRHEKRELPVILPADSSARKEIPIVSGVLDYFPNAIAYVAKISKAGNDKHNPGKPLHWSVNKSNDHAECIGRHLVDRGTIDPSDGMRHSGMLAWRALANLEEELVAAGAPRGRGAYES